MVGVGEELKKIFCDMCKSHKIQLLVSIKNVLLDLSHVGVFACDLWQLLHSSGKTELLQPIKWQTEKVCHFLYWPIKINQ